MHATALIAVGLLMAQLSDQPSLAVPAGEPTLASPEATEGPATASDTMVGDTPIPVEAEPRRLVPIRPADGGMSPAALVRKALKRPVGAGALAGNDVTLYDVLAGTAGRARRTELIHTYWVLSAALANYHFALDDERRLLRLADDRPDTQIPESQFQVALATAHVRVEQARLDAVTAQHRLAELRPPLLPSLLPLPADLPHAGPYRTLFDRFFSGQPVPAARRLHDTLPIQYELVRARAEAIRANRAFLSVATEHFESGRITAATVLTCHEQLAQRRRRFVAAIRDYNLDIAEYAQLVAPETLDAARLVAMLVTTETKPAAFLPSDRDGLTSVLTRPSVTGGGAHRDTGDRGVVRATAEKLVPETDTKSGRDAHAKDRFVPRRPGLEP